MTASIVELAGSERVAVNATRTLSSTYGLAGVIVKMDVGAAAVEMATQQTASAPAVATMHSNRWDLADLMDLADLGHALGFRDFHARYAGEEASYQTVLHELHCKFVRLFREARPIGCSSRYS